MNVDLSLVANQKMRIKVNADVACRILTPFWGSGASNWPWVPNIIDLAAGDNDITVVVNLQGIPDPSLISGIMIFAQDASADTAGVNVTLKFDFIQVGDAVTAPAATNNAIVDNSLISLYPNPAKDQVTVDLSALSGQDASVKVLNTFGVAVIEEVASSPKHTVSLSGLEKGIYLVQVTSGNKVSNKKVVVE